MLKSYTLHTSKTLLWPALIGLSALVPTHPMNATASATDAIAVTREMVPMRDGVELATDIFRPGGQEPFPVLVTRSPYSRSWERPPWDLARDLATSCYAVVVQDCRGTGNSVGDWEPYAHERQDGTDVDNWPFLRIFVMGENRWRDEQEWPLARTQYTPYYFHSGRSANTLDGDGTLNVDKPEAQPVDRFVYDPADPVPTHGGEWRFYEPCGPLDQREIERRPDVLVYTSEVLTDSLEVTGP